MGRLITSDPTPLDPVLDLPDADDVELEMVDELEKGPLRRCLVTRERHPKEALIRFVVSPDRVIVPDLAATLPGRGMWLSAFGDVIETACTRGMFAKAARGSVKVPPDLISVLQKGLLLRIGESLGLARRAGQAVCGFQKAREWLDAGRVGLVMEASDGSMAERERFLGRHAENVRVITPLDGAALGALFGRDHAVHVAIARGKLAERLSQEAERWRGVGSRRGQAVEMKERPRSRGRSDRQDPPVRPDGDNSRMQAGK